MNRFIALSPLALLLGLLLLLLAPLPTAAQSAATASTQPCSQMTFLAAVQAGEASGTLDLDPACVYELTAPSSDWYGGSGAVLQQTRVINGNGATIRRAASVPPFRLLALQVDGGTIIRDLVLENGDAGDARGGAIWANGNLTLENVTLHANRAALGGAIFAQGDLVLERATLTDNVAQRGGAIYALGDELSANQITLMGNRASDWGGGMVVRSQRGALSNALFVGNVSPRGGAAIHALGATSRLEITQSTFVGGEPGGAHVNPGAAIFSDGYLNLSNSILTGHDTALIAAGGSETSLDGVVVGEAKVREDYNLFAGNGRITQLLDAGTYVHHGGSSKLVADAGFADPAAVDYALRADSPAVDSGSTAGARALQVDAALNERPFEDTPIDMGAFEFQGRARPALSIVKEAPPWVGVGAPVTYVLVVANGGTTVARDLAINETLPLGLGYVRGSASDGGERNADGVLAWAIGDLSPGQERRVAYSAAAWQAPTGGDYRVFSRADETVEARGGPLPVALSTNIRGAVGFLPRPNGFRFPNYSTSLSDDLVADDVAFLFGAEHVCKMQNPCVLTATAEAWQRAQVALLGRGHGAGMAAGALNLFANRNVSPGDFNTGATTTYGLTQEAARRYVALLAAAQPLPPLDFDVAQAMSPERTPAHVLDTLLANLSARGFSDRFLLGFALADGSAAHLVVPHAVEELGADDYLLRVYDPNAPSDSARAVRLNRASGEWAYVSTAAPDQPLGDYRGSVDTQTLWLASWRRAITFPKRCDVLCAGDEPWIEFQLDGEGYLLVTRDDGLRAGMELATGAWIGEIGGAEQRPFAAGTGLHTPPLLRLPHAAGATYQIQIAPRDTAFGHAATVGLNVFAPGYAVRLTQLHLASPPVVPIALGDALSADPPNAVATVNLDPARQTLVFTAAPSEAQRDDDTPWIAVSTHSAAGADYTVNVRNLDVNVGETVAVGFDAAAQTITVENSDPRDNVYYLHIDRLNADGSRDVFEQSDAADGSGVGLRVAAGPAWDGVGAPVVTPLARPSLPGDGEASAALFLPLVRR